MRRFLRRFLLPAPAVRAEAGLARLRDETGVALVMALGTMLVLTIGLTSTVYMTSTSQRHAQHDNADQRAYALPEAGLNNAVAYLSSQYT
jgi:Tfp pilus assembly protein PilX